MRLIVNLVESQDKQESCMDEMEDEYDIMETDSEEVNMTEEDGQKDTDVEKSSEEVNEKAICFLPANVWM